MVIFFFKFSLSLNINSFKGHGVSSDTTGQTIVEPNSNEHYLGLVNVYIKRKPFLLRMN
jgi:hypothetical protein